MDPHGLLTNASDSCTFHLPAGASDRRGDGADRQLMSSAETLMPVIGDMTIRSLPVGFRIAQFADDSAHRQLQMISTEVELV